MKIPIRYLPNKLSKKDKKKQVNMIIKSKKLYKQNKYYTRSKLSSYKNKTSNHIVNARKLYNINNITPNKNYTFLLKNITKIYNKLDDIYAVCNLPTMKICVSFSYIT